MPTGPVHRDEHGWWHHVPQHTHEHTFADIMFDIVMAAAVIGLLLLQVYR